MAFTRMTVCNSSNQILDEEKYTIKTKSDDKFAFYVQRTGKDPTTSNTLTTPMIVTMIIPMGGPESGLFRYPRVGEEVLIASNTGDTDATGYFMGYVPSAALFDTEKFSPADPATKKDTGEGEAFRYGKSRDLTYRQAKEAGDAAAKKATDEHKSATEITAARDNAYNNAIAAASVPDYSEIGFYKNKTQWPKTSGMTDFPFIDQINIQSAGDIKSTAVNHHLIKAKRLEILAGCNEVDHSRNDLHNTDSGKNMPLGDVPGDDYMLKKGEIHIRSKGRLILKSAKEIQLQVGRTVVSITDTGFTVNSKILNSKLENTYDTTLELKSRGGISMFGEKVSISAGRNFSIEDSFGGSIGSTIGAVDVSGRNVNLSTNGWAAQILATAFWDLGYAANLTLASFAIDASNKGYDPTRGEEAMFYIKQIISWAEIAKKLGKVFFAANPGGIADKIKKSWQNFADDMLQEQQDVRNAKNIAEKAKNEADAARKEADAAKKEADAARAAANLDPGNHLKAKAAEIAERKANEKEAEAKKKETVKDAKEKDAKIEEQTLKTKIAEREAKEAKDRAEALKKKTQAAADAAALAAAALTDATKAATAAATAAADAKKEAERLTNIANPLIQTQNDKADALKAAKDAAKPKKDAAEAAETKAGAAETKAGTAETNAGTAETNAEAKENAARALPESDPNKAAAMKDAAAARSEADTARSEATTARGEATTARSEATTARDEADTAQGPVDTATREFDIAKREADTATEAAVTAREKNDIAQGKAAEAEAEKVKLDAKKNEVDTEKAKIDAEKAKEEDYAKRKEQAATDEKTKLTALSAPAGP